MAGTRRQEPYRQNSSYGNDPYGREYDPRGYRQDDPYQDPYRQGRYRREDGRQYRQEDNRYYQDRYEQDDYYEHENRRNSKKKKRKSKRKIVFAVEVLVLLVLAGVLFAAFKLSKIQKQNISKGDILINQEISPEEAKVLEGYTNIALYGVDSREGKMDIDAHSDALMIASSTIRQKM